MRPQVVKGVVSRVSRTHTTTDSLRQSSTSNIQQHLKEKHGILPPGADGMLISFFFFSFFSPDNNILLVTPKPASARKSTIPSLRGQRGQLTVQEKLEKNLLRWVVYSKQPFTAFESAEFQKIFADIPSISLPFVSSRSLKERLVEDFELQRAILKDEFSTSCHKICEYSRLLTLRINIRKFY